MAEQAAVRGSTIENERRMSYDAERGVYRYQVQSSLDLSDRYPDTTLWLDGDSGALRAFHAPSGEHIGTSVTTALFALHFASIAGGGLPYRLFVCMLGMAIGVLSVTGVWIWWRKRRPLRDSAEGRGIRGDTQRSSDASHALPTLESSSRPSRSQAS